MKSQDHLACQTILLLFSWRRTMGTWYWTCVGTCMYCRVIGHPICTIFFPRRYRFDFAVLLAEIVRHELALTPLRRWLFVDTLAILNATKDEVGPCLKLQCLVRHYANAKDLRAHRVARA